MKPLIFIAAAPRRGNEIKFWFDFSPFRSHIATNKTDVPVEDLYDHTVGLSISGDEPNSVDSITLLAFTNPNNRFS
ncbi:hypothetical protein [Cytobacillus kochii]|uniref:hypothetical protein n=1 Tax=Cytobacillus kochii TaxID=859143 RepID=UPI00402A95E7